MRNTSFSSAERRLRYFKIRIRLYGSFHGLFHFDVLYPPFTIAAFYGLYLDVYLHPYSVSFTYTLQQLHRGLYTLHSARTLPFSYSPYFSCRSRAYFH